MKCVLTCRYSGCEVIFCSQRIGVSIDRVPLFCPYDSGMAKRSGAMHVARITTRYRDRAGQERIYVSHLLRRSYRDAGKVKHENLANLSALPAEAIAAVRAVLTGAHLALAGPGGGGLTPAERGELGGLVCERPRPHGHVAAVHALARGLGFVELLGEPGRPRDLALALIVARVVRPASKLATRRWWARHHAGRRPGHRRRLPGRGVRRAGLAGRPSGRDRSRAGRPAPARRRDGAVRPVQLVDDRAALPAGRLRLLPRRPPRLPADHLRAAHRRRRPVAVRVFPGNT